MQLAFTVVLFGGLAYMFLTILRNQDAMLRTLRADNARLSERMARLEALLRTQATHPAPQNITEDSGRMAYEDAVPQPAPAGYHEKILDTHPYEDLSGSFSDQTAPRDAGLLPDPSAHQKGWKRILASGLKRIPERRQERELPADETLLRQKGATHSVQTSGPDELRLDWPEPASGKASRSSDGGMPELRL